MWQVIDKSIRCVFYYLAFAHIFPASSKAKNNFLFGKFEFLLSFYVARNFYRRLRNSSWNCDWSGLREEELKCSCYEEDDRNSVWGGTEQFLQTILPYVKNLDAFKIESVTIMFCGQKKGPYWPKSYFVRFRLWTPVKRSKRNAFK